MADQAEKADTLRPLTEEELQQAPTLDPKRINELLEAGREARDRADNAALTGTLDRGIRFR